MAGVLPVQRRTATVLRLLDDQQQDSVKTLFYLLLRDHLPSRHDRGLVADVEAQHRTATCVLERVSCQLRRGVECSGRRAMIPIQTQRASRRRRRLLRRVSAYRRTMSRTF